MAAVMIFGSVGSTLSFVGALFCTVCYEWKRSSGEASQGSLENIYHAEEGLWMRCAIFVSDVMSCDYYDTTIFDVPGYLQALRALAIISCLLLFGSTLCNILALDCITCVAAGRHAKVWLARTGGGSSFLAGILLIAAVSQYAVMIINEFNDSFAYIQQGFLYTFGAGLYVGWVAGGIAFICGAMVIYFSCYPNFGKEKSSGNPYKPTKFSITEVYV